MKKAYKNLDKLTYVMFLLGLSLLLVVDADSKICLIYSLVLMTYCLVSEFFSFNIWIADNAGELQLKQKKTNKDSRPS